MTYDRKTGWTASFTGVVAAPLTPFGGECELRTDLVPGMVDFLLARRVTGLMVGGTTGEFIVLDAAERRELLESFVTAVNGRARIIAHVGHIDRGIAVDLAEHAASVGADATAAIAPYYHGVTEGSMYEYFSMLAGATPDLPFFVYNFPGTTGNEVPFSLFESLMDEVPNVSGAKHSVGTFEELEPYLALPPYMCVMSGNDTLAPRFLRLGGRAIVSGNAAAFPDVLSDMVAAVAAGDDATTAIAQIDRIVEIGRSGAPDRLRQLLAARGIDIGPSRLATFSAAEVPAEHATGLSELLEELAG